MGAISKQFRFHSPFRKVVQPKGIGALPLRANDVKKMPFSEMYGIFLKNFYVFDKF